MRRVLIGCEFSGTVRDAFNSIPGIEATSCDLLPSSGRHIQGDLLQVIRAQPWDSLIAHPPCTYLCSSGLHWIARGRIESDGRPRAAHYEEALAFVRALLDAPIPLIALENPAGAIGSQIRPASQYVQPYEFGDDASKKTGLWLKGLPQLAPTQFVAPRAVCSVCGFCEPAAQEVRELMFSKGCPECGAEAGKIRPRWSNQTDSGQNKLTPSPDRGQLRSVTFPGIAHAMASQWTPIILCQK